MQIDLKEIPVLWINLRSEKRKYNHMRSFLKKHRFSNSIRIDAIQGVGNSVDERVASGCALSQAKAIQYFFDNFHSNQPVLILEDDVEIGDGFNSCFEIPDDADCVYLGISQWGINPFFAKRSGLSVPTAATPFNTNYLRIWGMLSTHAILHVSNDYKNAAMKICKKSLWHCDIDLANAQHHYRVYTPIDPYFVQKDYPNRAVTSPSLYFNEDGKLAPVFHYWWVKKYGGLSLEGNDEDLVVLDLSPE